MNSSPRVFLCHNSRDKPVVREIMTSLSGAGISSWIDEIELFIGDSLLDRIGRAIHKSDLVLAFLSPASVESNWVKKELSLAITREVMGQRIVVLPVLVEDCDLPFFLRDKLYADLRDPSRRQQETDRILRAIRHHLVSKSAQPVKYHRQKPDPTGPQLGETDLGRVVHDRGAEFLGYRCIRNHRRFGFAIWVQGLLFALLSLFPLFVFGNRALAILLVIFGAIITVGASLQLLAAHFFEHAYERDKRLLVEIEAIGPYHFPFDKKWWEQMVADRGNMTHRRGMWCETTAIFVWLFDVFAQLHLCFLRENSLIPPESS